MLNGVYPPTKGPSMASRKHPELKRVENQPGLDQNRLRQSFVDPPQDESSPDKKPAPVTKN